jgi:hypothetical protein
MATFEITLTGETIGTVARTSQERRQPAAEPDVDEIEQEQGHR